MKKSVVDVCFFFFFTLPFCSSSLERREPTLPLLLPTSPAMILSFYLPAMVAIVLMALSTCVLGLASWGQEGEKGKRFGFTLFRV